jgi:hypothetical protein
MNIIHKIGIMMLFVATITSCILEDVDPEYDVVGAVGTISTLTASSTTPTVGQTVTLTTTIFSEHENATELNLIRLVAGSPTTIDTKTFSSWNKEDSYRETFQYTVPAGTEGTAIVLQMQLITESGFSATRNITLNVAP